MATTIRHPKESEPTFEIVPRLERMTPSERLAASRAGFTPHERAVWASRYPDEVPLLNGEYEWIALGSADLD